MRIGPPRLMCFRDIDPQPAVMLLAFTTAPRILYWSRVIAPS